MSPILPMLWFWALAWVGVIEAKLVEVRWLRLLPSVVMVSLTVLIITSQAMQNDQAKAGHAYFNYSEKPEHLLPALDCLCNISKDQPGTFVVGIWNRLSAALVSQYCWSKHAPFPVLNSPQAVSANRILYGGGDWQRLQNRHGIETLLLTHYSGTYQKEFNFDTGRAQESYEAVRASEHFVRKPDLQCGELYRFEVYKAVTLER